MAKKTLEQKVIKGDCVKGANSLPKGKAKTVIADPPYNFGVPYDSYADNKTYAEYIKWTRQWMTAAVNALDKQGSLFVFVPDEWVSEIDMLARHELRLYKRRHIIWTFTFGVACQGNFSRSHCHILYFTKQKTNRTFNDDAIRVKSARTLVYKDKRANPKGKLPDATWMLLMDQLEQYMTGDTDVWLESRICGTFKERAKHSPNQIPLPIMERIIKATTNKGDTVIDMFAGTGGSGVAATLLGRNYIGYDVSPECVRQSNAKIAAARKKVT